MALKFSLVDTWDDGKRIHVSGTIAASGEYVQGDGDVLDLGISGMQEPVSGVAWLDGLNGFDYVYYVRDSANKGIVRAFRGGSPHAEIDGGTYPERIIEDAITFYGIFKK